MRLAGDDGAHFVHRLADCTFRHAALKCSLPTGNADGLAEALGFHAAHQAFGGLQRDGANAAFADVLRHFANDVDRVRNGESTSGKMRGSPCE